MATNNERYTVLTYNINGYEIIHPVLEKSDRARYIMVTDDPNLKDESGSWEIVVDDTLSGSTMDKCYQIRFNPFKYTDDKIVLRIDGSIGVNKSLDPIIDRFLKEPYDMSIMLHPTRQTLYDEYLVWVNARQYPVEQANAVLGFLQAGEGYPVKDYKGMLQGGFQIQRNNRLNNDFNRMVYAFLKYLGDKTTEIERVDQTIASFVLQKYFGKANIMFFDQRIIQCEYLTLYPHHSDQPFAAMDVKDMKEPYWLNKRIHNTVRPQDL